MISCYDQRPIDDIKNELLVSSADDIDIVAVCIVLCERIGTLEHTIQQLNSPDTKSGAGDLNVIPQEEQ